ncbi:MAG: hypothetical protein ACOYD3_08105, partial [Kiritimatiellia bacterium]
MRHKPHFVASFAGDFVAFVESNRESAREGAKVFFYRRCPASQAHVSQISADLNGVSQTRRCPYFVARFVGNFVTFV